MRQTLMQGLFGTVAPLSLLLLLLQAVASANSLEERLPRPSAVQCAKEGAIPDDESDTCATYYRCEVNTDHVLSPVLAQCPGSTVFSRELRQCVDASAYVCQRGRVRRDAGFQCTAQGRYPNEASVDCKSYYLCTKNTDGSLIAALVNCPSSTIFSAEKQSCVQSPPNICPYAPITTTAMPQSSTTLSAPAGPFVCPSEGRFANEQSPDCTTYYLCATINNQLVPKLTACGSSLIFAPSESKCVPADDYSCPKLTPTPALTTAELTTTTTTVAATSTDVTSDTPLTTPDSGSSPEVEITTPTTAPTTTTTVVSTESPTPTSTTLTSASESTTTAPETTTRGPTSSEASTTVSVETTESTTDWSVETTAETPTLTTTISVDITESTAETNPATTTTASETSTTINTEVTSVSSSTEGPTTETSLPFTTSSGSAASTTTPGPIFTTPSGVFECSAEGRYPDPSGSSCETYILCIRNSLGTLTPIQFYCPPTTIFSITVGLCVPASSHRCGSEPATTTTTSLPTTSTSTTPVITTPRPFVCLDTGRYPNPGSIYCKSYYLCLYDGNLNLIAVELSCPSGSIFATDVYRCVPEGDYQCVLGSATTAAAATTTTTAATTTTTAATTTSSATTIGMAGACTSAGKFPSDKTNDCSSYQFCIRLQSGELVEFIFKCPGNTVFDEQQKTCSNQVVCARGV